MREVYINYQQYSLESIREGKWKKSKLTDFERDTLSFLKEWLNYQPSYELQTSGSTGKPKKLQVRREQMEASGSATIDFFELHEEIPAIVCLPTRYIGGKMMLVRAIMTGMPIYAIEPEANPLNSPELPAGAFIALVPYQLQNILDNPASTALLNTAHSVIVGGAPISVALEAKIMELECEVYQTFGMTETISHIALRKLNGEDRNDYYELLPGVEAFANEQNQLVVRAEEITSLSELITNDWVEFIDERKFVWKGRTDWVINSGGIKIALESSEQQIGKLLYQQGLDVNFFLFGMDDELLGQKLVMVLEGNPQRDVILGILKEKLDTYHCPKEIFSIPAFSRTENGKLLRKESWEKVAASVE